MAESEADVVERADGSHVDRAVPAWGDDGVPVGPLSQVEGERRAFPGTRR